MNVRDPMFSLLVVGAALVTAKFMHGMVDHFWSRGSLPAWIGGGMAVAAASAVLRRPVKATVR